MPFPTGSGDPAGRAFYATSGAIGGGGMPSWVTPPPMNQNTERNPQLAALQNEYGDYRKNLAAGTDLDATHAMARQRSLTSGMAKEAGEMATFRAGAGGVAAEMQGRAFSRGQGELGKLNSDMTADARRLQLSALAGQTGAASAEAGANLGQQQHALNSWQAYQGAANANMGLYQNQQQNQIQTMMQMLQTLGPGGLNPGGSGRSGTFTGFGRPGLG